MTVSMDGLRRNLASAYARTVKGYREVLAENGYDDSFDELKGGLDDLRQMVAALMCVYSSDPDDLMKDMGDECDKLPYADPSDNRDEDDK